MIGLLRAEVLRLTSRRVVRILAVAALGLILLVQGVAFARSSKDVEGARRRQEIAAQREAIEGPQREIARCLAAQQAGKIPAEVDCTHPIDGGDGPTFEFSDPRYDAARLLPDGTKAVAVGVAIVAFIVGASFVGGEWGAGTMQALLFWEPRRGRVVLAKAAALVLVLVAFLAVAEVVGWLTTVLNGSLRGTTDGLTAGRWASAALAAGRGAGLVSFTGLFGFAIAGLARVTGAALGASFVYFVILENLVRGLRPGWSRFLIGDNCVALLNKGADVPSADPRLARLFPEFSYRLGGARGALTLAVYLALLLGAFVVTFERRDVT